VATAGVLVLAGCSNPQTSDATPIQSSKPTTGSTRLPVATDTASTSLPGYVHVPGGFYAHESCVHGVPNGATVQAGGLVTLNGSLVNQFHTCAYPTFHGSEVSATNSVPGFGPGTGGWVENTWANATTIDGVSYFNSLTAGSFVVPPAPATPNGGQLVYMFPSMQSCCTILQPVLQWGTTGAGGAIGSYSNYTYAAWTQLDGVFYHTATPLTPSSGHTLGGSITLITGNGGFGGQNLWLVTALDETADTSAVLYVAINTSELFTNAQGGVLEAYSISTCNEFPGTLGTFTVFGVAAVTQGGPAWNNFNSVTPTWTPGVLNVSPVYSGPSCDFDAAYSTSSGTTLEY